MTFFHLSCFLFCFDLNQKFYRKFLKLKRTKMDEDSYIKLCRLCLSKPEGEPSWLTNQKIKDEFFEAISDVEVNFKTLNFHKKNIE